MDRSPPTSSPSPAAELDLDALTRAVADRLRALGLDDEAADGRVSAVPDARTVRYYQSLGLVDRPLVRERRARYGPKQVLQLVAIKALQQRHLPLAEVQARLYGRSERELAALVEAAAKARRPATPLVRAVRRREVTIEPGLVLVAEDGWHPTIDRTRLVERLQAALDALGGEEPATDPTME